MDNLKVLETVDGTECGAFYVYLPSILLHSKVSPFVYENGAIRINECGFLRHCVLRDCVLSLI